MKGQLLVAHPLLNDGYFNRSVVLVADNNEDGSFGFVLNFKTQFKLRDVRPQMNVGNFPIYEGGPVGKDQLFFIHSLGEQIESAVEISKGLYFGGDFEKLLQMIEHQQVSQEQVRFFAGYSGWGEGQLEKEKDSGCWIDLDAGNGELLQIDTDNLWRLKLEAKKKSLGLFASIGFDPSLN